MLMKSTGLFALAILLFLPRLGHATDEKAPPMKFDRMALYDVHGLWGGQNVYLTHGGTAWVQVSQHVAGKPGFQELRYKLSLKPAEMQSLEKLLAEHHFPDITSKDRPGVPDESRPTIEVVAGGI